MPRLLLEVGELTTRDLMAVQPACRSAQAALERRVGVSHRLPIGLEVEQRVEREAGRARSVVRRPHDARDRRLAGHARHRRERAVDGVDAGLDRRQIGRELAAGRVVRVQVHRNVELAAQPRHERARGGRAQQARHVLDREHVHTGFDELLGEAQVVVERVALLAGVGEIARVTDGSLRDGAGFERRGDGDPHRLGVVERIEDAEDVDPRIDRLGDERTHERVGVGLVAEQVAAAQQHLQADVRHRLAQAHEAVPRILGEESQRDVERRAAPHSSDRSSRQRMRVVRRHEQHVDRAQPRGKQRLMRVTHRRVRHRKRLLSAQRLRELRRAERGQPLARSRRRSAGGERGQLLRRVGAPGAGPCG